MDRVRGSSFFLALGLLTDGVVPLEVPVSTGLPPEMQLFLSFSSVSRWATWSRLMKTLLAISSNSVAFFFLQILLISVTFYDVQLGLSHKGSIYHPLVLRGIRIIRGEDLKSLT